VAEGAAAMWELVAAGAATMLLSGRPRMGHGGEEWRRLLERTRGQSSPTVGEQRRTPPPPRAPLSPLLVVAGTNRRGGCARGCSKPLEPLVCLGEVCSSLFSAEEVFCRCRTAMCCGQFYARERVAAYGRQYSTWPAGLVISPLAQVCPAL
jgi:hypothetical protein